MPGGGQIDARAAVGELDAGERDGHEAGRALAQQRVVEAGEHVARAQPGDGVRAQRVAGERGHRGRLRALAADVADDQRPAAVALREDVVEVAADLVALARGAVARGQLQPGDLRQVRRQQRALQRLGGARALLVEARVLDRDRRLGGDALDHALVVGGEHARLRVAEEQPAGDLALGGDDRHREVAAHRQVALRHAVVRRAVAVARVGEHVVEAHDPLAVERRREDRRCCAASGSARRRSGPRPRACRACTPRRRRRRRCRRRRRRTRG